MNPVVIPDPGSRFDPIANAGRATRVMADMIADARRRSIAPDTNIERGGQRGWSITLPGARSMSVTWSPAEGFGERRLRIVCFRDDLIVEAFVSGIHGGDDPEGFAPVLDRVVTGLATVASADPGDRSLFDAPAAAIMLDARDRHRPDGTGMIEITAAAPWAEAALGMQIDDLVYETVDDRLIRSDLALLPQAVTLTAEVGRKQGRESIVVHAGQHVSEIDPTSVTAVTRLRLAAELVALRNGDHQ